MVDVMRYNSWDRNFKAPFGALKTSQNATIKVKVNKNFNPVSYTHLTNDLII